MKNSKYCVFIILVTQCTLACLHGVHMVAMNTPTPAISHFINQSYTLRYGEVPEDATVTLILTLVHSTLVWGTLVGSLLVQPTLRVFSARKAVILIHIVHMLSVVLMGPTARYTYSYEALIIGRILAGLVRGIGYTVVIIIVAEFTSQSDMGIFQTPFQLCIDLSSAITVGIGHHQALGNPENWMWIVCVPAIPSLVYFCCCAWIPQSPLSLLREGKRDCALNLLRSLRKENVDLESELDSWECEIKEEACATAIPIQTIFKNKHLRLQFFVVLIVSSAVQFVGATAIVMYSNDVLLRAGVDEAYVTFASIALNLMSIISFLAYVAFQRKLGTKKVFIIGISICFFSLTLFAIANDLSESISWASYLALAAMFCNMFGVYLGPILCLNSLPAELTTAASRPTATSYSISVYWVIGASISFIFPYSIDALNAYAFIPFIVLTFLMIPFSIFYIPDTRARSIAQIQNSFRKKSVQSISEVLKIPRKENRGSHRRSENHVNSYENRVFNGTH